MDISQALEELIGPPILGNPFSTPIPSAPAVIEGQSINVFNPDALTIDIPTPHNIEEEEQTTGPLSIESDTDSDTDSDADSNTAEASLTLTDLQRRQLAIPRPTINHLTRMSSELINERECSICYNKFDIDNIVNTTCKHIYCKSCFFRWMKNNVTCAMCRNNFTSWRRHSKDEINNDIKAVTIMFNNTLKEHVHLNKLNKNIAQDVAILQCEKKQLMKSLISTRELLEFNKGYAEGLLSIFRPKYTGNSGFDRGLMKGYEEFKETIKNERKKKRSATNQTYLKSPVGKIRKTKPFVFHGNV